MNIIYVHIYYMLYVLNSFRRSNICPTYILVYSEMYGVLNLIRYIRAYNSKPVRRRTQ